MRGELGYRFSPSARQVVFYPRVIAPTTGVTDLEWRVSKGLGTVHATTLVHPRQGAPYNVCLVEGDELFHRMIQVDDIEPAGVKIGLCVPTPEADEDPYPAFTPVRGT